MAHLGLVGCRRHMYVETTSMQRIHTLREYLHRDWRGFGEHWESVDCGISFVALTGKIRLQRLHIALSDFDPFPSDQLPEECILFTKKWFT
mmetsp:Transcript_4422/g.7720  ORF Transcript_4422/g.7720 Transcript_4422/m.7720 type:complete len:91 (-) Transcript_4422:834-1106(-)